MSPTEKIRRAARACAADLCDACVKRPWSVISMSTLRRRCLPCWKEAHDRAEAERERLGEKVSAA